jgi:hypothetical protein
LHQIFNRVNITKIRWVPLLMIISQLMLAGFVAYWLTSQYKEEKKILNEDLARIYEDSRNQVIDSLLFSYVVEPALKDSITITMLSGIAVDSTNHKVLKPFDSGNQYRPFDASSNLSKSDSCNQMIVAVTLPDSLKRLGIKPGTAFAFGSKRQDLLIRSVKLFINHSSDTIERGREFSGFLPGNPDTVLFKKLYTDRVQKKNYGIAISWGAERVKNDKRDKNDKNGERVKEVLITKDTNSAAPDHASQPDQANQAGQMNYTILAKPASQGNQIYLRN